MTIQKHIARHFASKLADPFAEVSHVTGKTGCPIIDGADLLHTLSVL